MQSIELRFVRIVLWPTIRKEIELKSKLFYKQFILVCLFEELTSFSLFFSGKYNVGAEISVRFLDLIP